MGRLIEEQAVIGCLTNTAKYYEREDADEWTKGIHYGLLHGLDNILDNVPTVLEIPDNPTNGDMLKWFGQMYNDLSKEWVKTKFSEDWWNAPYKPQESEDNKCPCYDCKHFEKEGWSHCKIHEWALGDSKCSNYEE